ncbi:retrovirus-related pol polyprotein from transposon TNT 1-94 [Tanacetum coccineum]|uniref:Retrovirus-related pol polyprotein from transposon TNT 1-94 n=1 Tax=Tanacetum coccineum TaxID=301880 RepID=A0ABQ5C1M1_9ASTR
MLWIDLSGLTIPVYFSGLYGFLENHVTHLTFEVSSGYDALAYSTAKADPGLSTPNDSIPLQKDQTKFVRDRLKSAQTDSGTNKESRSNEISKKIKLEDLSDLLKDTRYAFFTPDSPQDEPIIISDESEEEKVAKDKDTHASSHDDELEQQKAKAEAEVASLKASYSYPNINQLTNLLVTSLKPGLSKHLASHNFASCLPTELKELPSKFIELFGEIKELKKHVVELKNIQWELPVELQALPALVSSVQIPRLLSKVTETLNRFATVVENALEATTKVVPSAGQATASPAEGEKNTTKDAETKLQNELVDLLGIDVVEQYQNKKLLFDKYCDKILKRRKSSKIINCDVITQKGPISLKVYREDKTIEVIANLKVSELHLAEWREVVQACPDRKEKGWKTIYGLIKTRMEYLDQTEKELNIDFNKPLKEQDPLNELNEFANKKRKRTSDLKDHSRFFNVISSGPWKIGKYLHFILCSGTDPEELKVMNSFPYYTDPDERHQRIQQLVFTEVGLLVQAKGLHVFNIILVQILEVSLRKAICAMSRYQFISGSNINRPELAFEVCPILPAIPIPRKSQRKNTSIGARDTGFGRGNQAKKGFGIAGSIGQTSNANLDMGDDVDINTFTMEQYLALIQDNIRPGIVKPEIGDDVEFEINENFMRELRHKLFKGTDEEDAHEHIRRVLEIADLFHFPGVTHDAVMLRVFPITLTGSALRWKNRFSAGSITTWDLLEKAFIRKYCPPFKTTMKLEKIRNFQQEMDKTLYHA